MKKKIIILLILLLSVFTLQVEAKQLPGFYAKEELTLEKKIDATLFAAGEDVDVKSEVDGASFVAGSDVTLSSKQDIIFAAGQNINLKNATTKDAFLAGSKIDIEESTIRDLFVVGETIRIDSDISRNIYAGGSTITINSRIEGDVYLTAETIRIGKNAQILGTLNYPDVANISISESAIVGKKSAYTTTSDKKTVSIGTTIVNKVTSFISLLLVAFVSMFILKKSYKGIEEMESGANEIIKNTLVGLAALFAVPFISVIAMCTGIGLPLGLIALTLYIILIYLSTIATAYYVADKYLKDKVSNKYLSLTITIACIYILKLIPGIGGLVGFISLCLGLGIYVKLIKINATADKKIKKGE